MNPIKWQDDSILVLDQRALPASTQWVTIRSAREMAEAIQAMVLRGAPLIGIAAAYALALEARNPRFDNLQKAATLLQSTRPTAVNLSWAITRMLNRAAKNGDTHLFLNLLEEARAIHDEDRKACLEIGKQGARLLPSGTVLTHCNTGALATGGEGTAYAAVKEAYRQKKISRVFVCEARPYLQGARLTAFELQEDGIPFTLITDSMAGHMMASGKVNSVIVGADRIAANGDTANKIGTYTLAVLAKECNIPFVVAAPTSTLDKTITTGKEIRIEERNPHEVTQFMGILVAPKNSHAAHPAFDVTPAKYIQVIVTEHGIAAPPNRKSVLALLNHAKI